MNCYVPLSLFAACTACLQAQVLFTYEFPGADPAGDATVPSAVGLSLAPLGRVNVGSASQTDVFTSSHWTTAAGRDPGEYVSLSLSPQVGYGLTLGSLSWDTSRTSTGPQKGAVELFVDGTSWASTGELSIGTTMSPQQFDFADVSLSPAQTAEFRFFGWGASSTGNLRLDNVAGAGQVTVVPEPTPLALMAALGLLGFAFHRRRHDD